MCNLEQGEDERLISCQDDITELLSVPYTPQLFEGDGVPVLFHIHFKFDNKHKQLNRQFVPVRAAHCSRDAYISWIAEHSSAGSTVPMTERAALEAQHKDNLTKPKEQIPFSWAKGKDAARMRIIFSSESEGKNGANGDFTLRSRTIRISGASPSALDKRNVGFSRLTPLVEFLKLPESASVGERTCRIALRRTRRTVDGLRVRRSGGRSCRRRRT